MSSCFKLCPKHFQGETSDFPEAAAYLRAWAPVSKINVHGKLRQQAVFSKLFVNV